jgi:large subunit ribosomal protein L21
MQVYAVVETGGKQYRVAIGHIVDVERLDGEVGKKVKLERVLAYGDGKDLAVGTPVVSGVAVTAEVLEQFRGDKVVAFKKKRRKGYKRKVGHRQELTRLKILEIGKPRKSRGKAAEAEAPAAPAADVSDGALAKSEGENHGA